MISVEHLTKCYGDVLAVDDLSFEINEGHVYGFLGPNGAGKSTTMNIMTGCLSATSGSISIDGHDIFEEPLEAKKLVGYLPEQPPLYMNESPIEYLRFVGEAKGLHGEELKRQIASVITQTKIENVRNRRISALSKGYRQRVGIAQALLGNPKVIILDEPTVGLDPIQIIEIRSLIKELGRTHTVIFSSHILSEVQAICDQILIIAKGKLIAFGGPEDLERQLLTSGELIITTDASGDEISNILNEKKYISDMQIFENAKVPGLMTAKIHTGCDDIYEASHYIFTSFVKNGKELYELSLKKADLEDVFIELTEGNIKEPENTDMASGTKDLQGEVSEKPQNEGTVQAEAQIEEDE